LHFLYFCFVTFVLIFSKHVASFILEVFDIICVFLDFKRVPECEVGSWLSDFVSFKDIGVRIFFIGLDKSQVFGHFFNIDGYGFIVDDFFVDGEDVSSLVGKLEFVEVVGEHGVGTKEVLAVASEEDHVFGSGTVFSPFCEFGLVEDLELHLGPDERVVRVALLHLRPEVVFGVKHAFEILNLHFLPIRNCIRLQVKHTNVVLEVQVVSFLVIKPSEDEQPRLELIRRAAHSRQDCCPADCCRHSPEDVLLG
jgi:hypothetical protein